MWPPLAFKNWVMRCRCCYLSGAVKMTCMWSSWCHCHPINSCFIKIQTGFTFLVLVYPGCPRKHTQPFYSSLDFVQDNPRSQYQKKHSLTHTYRGHQSSLICFLHLLRSMASSLFNLCTWQSFSTVSLQVFFGLPLGLWLSWISCRCNLHNLRGYHRRG